MLSFGLIDANEHANKVYAGLTGSVVGGWLTWEVERHGISFVEPSQADIVFLAFSGALDFSEESRKELKRRHIQPRADIRESPYVITGGPVDAIPLTALELADAVAVGEGYNFVRILLAKAKDGATVDDIRAWLIEYPHSIERCQVAGLKRDESRPWLLASHPECLASPDDYIDWDGMPPIRSDDKVVRIVASKGCHLKCAFCATTYRQKYQANPNGDDVAAQVRQLSSQGERVQLLSNDPANLDYFTNVIGHLDSESFTILEVGKQNIRDAIAKSKIRISRFGVEGISERIRVAFGKAITNEQLLFILSDFHSRKLNTHMFYIPGAPYETDEDWADFRGFYEQVTRTIRTGMCRIKFTKFLPTPPSPLARYVTDRSYERRMLDMRRWISGNAASRHIVYISPRMGKTYTANVAEQLSVNLDVADDLVNQDKGTIDIAPDLDMAHRLPWELIDWPIPTETRWKIGEVYRQKMGQTLTRTLSRI